MILASFSILLISGYFTYSSYQKNITGLKEIELSKLKAIVSTLSAEIDGDLHQNLIEKYIKKDAISKNEDDSSYLKIQRFLLKAKKKNDLKSDIYTIVLDKKQPENSFFGVSSSNPYFRHSYSPPNETLLNFNNTHTLEPYKDAHGTWISAFAPVFNSSNEPIAIVQADIHFDEFIEIAEEKAVNELLTIIGIVFIILASILFLLNYMLNKLKKQQNNLLNEFDKLDELSNYIEQFLNRILSGKFKKDDEVDNFSDKENPIYLSLLDTEKKVAISTQKEHEQQWVLEGESKLAAILQKNESVEILSNEVLKYIVDYSNSTQGNLYLWDEKDESLKMIARYAYNRKKYEFEDFKIGEDLVGQCGFEKEPIYRTEVPETYFKITSGIKDDVRPTSLFFVPLLNNKDLLGVIEIASNNEMNEATQNFIESASNITSQTLFNILTNEKTKQFLNEALEMGKELKEQKLTLEQNAEEMKATQEEIVRTNEKLEEQIQEVENQQNKLHSLLLRSSEIISIYSEDGKIMYESPSVERILGYKPEELIGKQNSDRLSKEDKIVFNSAFDEIIKNPLEPQTIQFRYKKKNGKEIWLESTGRNLLQDNSIKGIVFNSIDITERRAAEKEQEMRAKMQALSEILKI